MSGPLPASVYRRRRLLVGGIVALALLLAVGGTIRLAGRSAGSDAAETEPAPRSAVRPGGDTPASNTTAPPPATSTTVATGRFTTAGGRTEVVGSGPVQTYTVEVEEGTGIDADAFAAAVDATLADPRGWTTADGIALQRVDRGPATFTVRLATAATTDLLCFPLDTDGAVSCAQNGAAVLNLTRWLRGAAPSKLDLTGYRHYLVSHEVGHVLGHHHVDCPGPGVAAPTMVQQTLGIGDCTPNPWPAPDVQAG